MLLLIIQTGGPVAKAHVCKQKDTGSIPGPSVLLFSQRLHADSVHYVSRRPPCAPAIQPMDYHHHQSNAQQARSMVDHQKGITLNLTPRLGWPFFWALQFNVAPPFSASNRPNFFSSFIISFILILLIIFFFYKITQKIIFIIKSKITKNIKNHFFHKNILFP